MVKQTIVLALIVSLVAGFAVQIQQVSADSFVMGCNQLGTQSTVVPSNTLVLMRVQASASIPVNTIYIACNYLFAGQNDYMQAVMYSDDNNGGSPYGTATPGVLLDNSSLQLVTNGGNGQAVFEAFTGLNTAVTEGVYYWIGLFTPQASVNGVSVSMSWTGPLAAECYLSVGSLVTNITAYGGEAFPLEDGGSGPSMTLSVYATSGTPTPTPTPSSSPSPTPTPTSAPSPTSSPSPTPTSTFSGGGGGGGSIPMPTPTSSVFVSPSVSRALAPSGIAAVPVWFWIVVVVIIAVSAVAALMAVSPKKKSRSRRYH